MSTLFADSMRRVARAEEDDSK
jgi:hypothetical protein